jgi:catechol 2,3-dioxygenase-like lactoylglutathione lyase family enzyme
MSLRPRVSLITLGVADVERSTAFYQRLGWRRSKGASNDSISFFALDNLVLALFSRTSLAEDAGLTDEPARPEVFKGMTLAHNAASETEVDAALAHAKAAGARILKPAQKAFWGGYSGYFADPDGHAWEVAFNPHLSLSDAGALVLPS